MARPANPVEIFVFVSSRKRSLGGGQTFVTGVGRGCGRGHGTRRMDVVPKGVCDRGQKKPFPPAVQARAVIALCLHH